MKFILIYSLLVFTFLYKVNSQPLDPEEAVAIALKNNPNLKIADFEEKIARANYKQTDAVFLPQITAGYTALSTNNPLNAFGFNLQQATIKQEDFNPDLLNNPSATQDYSAKIDLIQPLLNPDMIYMRKGAKLQTELYQYKKERTREYIAYEVQKAYLQLQMSYQAEKILSESLENIQKIKVVVGNFYKQGLVQHSDVLNAQVQVNTVESALAKAKSNIRNASEGLGLLMGDESKSIYEVKELQFNLTSGAILNLSNTRADFLAMEKAIEASNMMVKSAKMNYFPRVNAFGSYQYNDANPFGFGANSYLVGVNLQWKLFGGNQTKGKVQSYRSQRDKLSTEYDFQKKQSQFEVDKTRRDLSDIQAEISKHESSVEYAQSALTIIENRYAEGLISTSDLLAAQTQLAQQKLMLAQAIFSYNVTSIYLDLLLK